VVKTRLQIQRRVSIYAGIRSAFRSIIQVEGIRGLFCGLTPLLMGLVPTWMIYFSTYSYLKDRLEKQGLSKESKELLIVAAVGAGVVSDVCTAPLWLVKTRIMTQIMKGPQFRPYKGIFDCYRRAIEDEGFFSLWRGLGPQMLGLIHVAIQFPLYEWLKKKEDQSFGSTDLSVARIMVSSSVAKIVASIVAYPHEVLRSRIQYQHKLDANRYLGIRGAGRTIWREEGFRGFYKGLTANLIRTIPATAISFSIYERVISILQK